MQDTVCCGCSVVCDDVAVSLKKSDLQSLGLCTLGHAYCASIRSKTRLTKPQVKMGTGKQQAVSLSAAYEQAVSILSESKRPLLLGWSNSPSEVSSLGITLAKRLKGVFDSTASFEYGRLLDYKLVGGEAEKATLEDVRNFADFIVYWGVNPAESHHRHASRYTVFPKGTNIPEGRESRVIAVVDIRESESMRLANHQLILDPRNGDEHFLNALLNELKGTLGTPPEQVGGVPAIEFLSFSKQIKEADYIAIFYGNGLLHAPHESNTLPLLAKVANRLDKKKRPCVILPMVTLCNSAGVVKTSLEETGLPFLVDFTSQTPKPYPSMQEGLRNNEFDAALIVGWDALSFLPGPIAKSLQSIPIISLSTQPTMTTRESMVVIPTALTGVEADGTVYRMDGVAVPLKPFAKAPQNIPTEHQVITHLLTQFQ
ncbi:MAG: formylmethanofuran dehydrogenase subunit B [Candidatus Hermodarchaeota archaeon]|nr:formylmethanofuran dehydrogenase subunit B [Candidatus Hermodarchaeota archaeon]